MDSDRPFAPREADSNRADSALLPTAVEADRAALALSPSLRNRSSASRAFETKVLVSEAEAAAIVERLGTSLLPDPHRDGVEDDAYALTTLYFDTPDWDVYRRRGRFRLVKFRARRYGSQNRIFLERKFKKGQQVRKRRTTLALEEAARLFAENETIAASRRSPRGAFDRYRLRPVCLLSYRRTAYVGSCNEGPLRLTFDRAIEGSLAWDWTFRTQGVPMRLLDDRVVCEFKYQDRMPAPFKAALEAFRLLPEGVSKFRRCLDAFGVAAQEGDAHA